MAKEEIILSAAKKDYSTFKKELSVEVDSKMKEKLSGFLNFLEKSQFAKKD
jgi:hypothetical protein